VTGTQTVSYTTPPATAAMNETQYRLYVATSSGYAYSQPATLTVTTSGTTPPTGNPAAVAPAITTQPANQTVTAGQTATFSVAASGTAPMTYQWQKGGANISGATSSSYTTPATTMANSGSSYGVVVSNSTGSATSGAATLTVNAASGAPAITTQPANQTVSVGQTATFTVTESGYAQVAWQSFSVGTTWSGITQAQYVTGTQTVTYTTPPATAAMNGTQYRLYVATSAGYAYSQAATLTVTQGAVAPTITTQPASQTVNVGQTATFSVAASGTAPMSYQWQKGGVNISGATSSSYTTPATTTASSGSTYDVVVSNSAGNVASGAATLSVTASDTTPPTVSITSPTSGATVSGTITVSASASDNAGIASVQFEVDGTSVGAADTTSPYSFSLNTTTLSNGSHDLTAVATDTSANKATSIAIPVTVSNQASSSAVPTYANNGAGCPINTVAGGPTDAVTSYNCPLPNPTGAGNLLVVWVRYEGTSAAVTFTDNIGGDTYNLAATCNNATSPQTQTGLYYVQNTPAGISLVSSHFSSSTSRVQMVVYEFYNVAGSSALDQAACQSSSGTSISSGALPTLSASGDLLVQFGHGYASTPVTSCAVGSQANITWTMRSALIAPPANEGTSEPLCAQYGIYNATASFNPTMTFAPSISYMSVAAAFKSAPAGTAPPSGIRVAYVQHDNGSDNFASSFSTELPLSGNLAVEIFVGGCGGNTLNSCVYAQSISDGTNSWAQIGATYLTSTGSTQEEPAQMWYAKNVTPGLHSFTAVTNPQSNVGNPGQFPQTWILYDIVGASSNPLDLGFGGSGSGLATFGSINTSGNITTFTVTPSQQNEVVIVSSIYASNTMTGITSPSGAQFVGSNYTTETNYSWDDSNGAYALFYNGLSTAAETWTFTHDTSQGAGSGRGLAIGAAFIPANE
jgi:Bacterial Ig domain/Immunoglobulin I-set domain